MKLRRDIKIQRRWYHKGDEISWLKVYPFFLFHIGIFGVTAVVLAYAETEPAVPLGVLYGFSAIALLSYLAFYLRYFGRDSWKWMLLNSGLGLFAFFSQAENILGLFGRQFSELPWAVHAVPTMFFMIYTFFLRQAVLDLNDARENPQPTEKMFVITLVMSYSLLYLWSVQ